MSARTMLEAGLVCLTGEGPTVRADVAPRVSAVRVRGHGFRESDLGESTESLRARVERLRAQSPACLVSELAAAESELARREAGES